MQAPRVRLCATLFALCWILTLVINEELVNAAKSNQRTRSIQMRQNSEINSKREDLQDGFSEDTQMDEPGAEEMVEKQKPKGKKTPEELLAGKLHHKMLNIQKRHLDCA